MVYFIVIVWQWFRQLFEIYISGWQDRERKGGCILLSVGARESGS
jgi:hypothetical protein